MYDKVVELLKGSGIEFRRKDRLDVALCVGLPITLVFLPAADIAKFVGDGNVDIGITGYDVVQESQVDVETVTQLGFGKCKLAVQAPVVDNITNVELLAGKRIATSFPDVTKSFFGPIDEKLGTTTSVNYVSGSVEAACGLGLADAVVDLVETGTTMRVSFFGILVQWKDLFLFLVQGCSGHTYYLISIRRIFVCIFGVAAAAAAIHPRTLTYGPRTSSCYNSCYTSNLYSEMFLE